MFDGLDCCGYDRDHDGDYDDFYDIAPGDTALCTECLCKGMYVHCRSIRNNLLVLNEVIFVSFFFLFFDIKFGNRLYSVKNLLFIGEILKWCPIFDSLPSIKTC